jgi:hypothetical protein
MPRLCRSQTAVDGAGERPLHPSNLYTMRKGDFRLPSLARHRVTVPPDCDDGYSHVAIIPQCLVAGVNPPLSGGVDKSPFTARFYYLTSLEIHTSRSLFLYSRLIIYTCHNHILNTSNLTNDQNYRLPWNNRFRFINVRTPSFLCL